MKQRRLLNKTLLYYLAFGGLMILTAISAYYLYYNKYYLHEIDEYLLERQNEVHHKSLATLTPAEIPLWNRFNDNDEAILPDNGQTEEYRFVTEQLYNENEEENTSYRVLYSRLTIGNEDHILQLRLSMYEAKKIIKSGIVLQIVLFSVNSFFEVLFKMRLFPGAFFFRTFWRPKKYQKRLDTKNSLRLLASLR